MRVREHEKPLSILLVEDSANDEALLVSILEREGLHFTHNRVFNAEGFMAQLERGGWDLVISDYNLPAFSAEDVLEILSAHADDMPCIIISGFIGEETAVALMKAGACDFVPKSNLSRLVPAIRREAAEAAMRREKRSIQKSLDHKEMLLSSIILTLGEGLVVTDEYGEVLFINPEAERLLGWRQDEVIGRNLHDTIHFQQVDGSSYPQQECLIDQFTRQGASYRSDNEIFVRKDGSRFDAACIATPVVEEGRVVSIITAFQDVSLRKQAERELLESRQQYRALSNFLQTVREEERTRIARELHDELGQALTALKMDASWIMHRLTEQQPELVVKTDKMLSLIDSTVDSMRRIAANLRPGLLDDLGLAAAAEWLLDECRERTGIRYVLNIGEEDFALDASLSTTIFRILQEAVTNVTRHAKAKAIEVELRGEGDEMLLVVSDDGIGFDPQMLSIQRKSFGLLGMRERVKSLGGQFELSSQPGHGTQLRIHLPKTADQT